MPTRLIPDPRFGEALTLEVTFVPNLSGSDLTILWIIDEAGEDLVHNPQVYSACRNHLEACGAAYELLCNTL